MKCINQPHCVYRCLPVLPVVLAVVYTCSCTHKTDNSYDTSDTFFFVMAGQSNMAGRGIVSPQDTVTDPHIIEMDGNFQYQLKHEPNTLNQGSLAGLDCGMSFGKELRQHLSPGKTVGLIQCSISSTSIDEWLGDSLHAVRLYTNLLERALACKKSGKLKAMLWMQGESNADAGQLTADYDDKLVAFILKTRQDLQQSELPVMVALLPPWSKEPYKDSVNAGIRRAAGQIPGVFVIQTNMLSAKPDSIHLDAAGQRGLGKRMAEVAWQHL